MKRYNPWPAGLILFFSLFFAGSIGFIIFSTCNPVQLVSRDYYQQEIQFQDQIDRQRLTRKYQATIDIQYDEDEQILWFKLPLDHARARVSGKILFYRPSNARLDRAIPLALTPEGTQTVRVDELKAGLWKIKIYWATGQGKYYHEVVVVIKPS